MKKTLLTFSMIGLVALTMATPAQAAEGGMFANFRQGVKQRFDRLYLMLPGTKDGQTVLMQSATAMEGVTSFHMDMKLDGEVLSSTDQKMFGGNIKFAGPVKTSDVYDPAATQQDLNLAGEFTMQGTTMRGNVDMKIDGKTSYLKFNELPAMPFMDLTQLQGQWLKLDPSEMADAETPAMTDEQKAEAKVATEELMKAATVSDARKENLNQHSVFVVDVTLPDAAVAAYVKKMAEIQKTPAEEMQQQAQQLNDFLAATDELKSTLYIDRSSFYTRRMTLPLQVNVKQLMASANAEAESSSNATAMAALEEVQTLKAMFSLDMDKFNEPVTFQAPSDARDFQEAFSGIFGGAMGASGTMPTMMTDEDDVPAPKMPAGTRPSGSTQLTPEEEQLLKEYGIQVEDL
ncbi:MAG TPA: DUF6612 family protein [Vitreimonas sp.]|nr:DUF6612 family protein [Vitreimonas sp.]